MSVCDVFPPIATVFGARRQEVALGRGKRMLFVGKHVLRLRWQHADGRDNGARRTWCNVLLMCC